MEFENTGWKYRAYIAETTAFKTFFTVYTLLNYIIVTVPLWNPKLQTISLFQSHMEILLLYALSTSKGSIYFYVKN